MLKKLTLLAMSVAALVALAAPAAQAANPLITGPLGEPVTKITALSTNTTTHVPGGTKLECTTVDLRIHLTKNTNNEAEGHGTGEGKGTPGAAEPAKHSGHCGTSSGLIAEITTVTVSNINLTKHGTETTGTATFTYTYDLRSGATPGSLVAECTFSGTVPVKKTGADTINVIGKIAKTGGTAFCPTEGEITGDFTLTDEETGQPVVIG